MTKNEFELLMDKLEGIEGKLDRLDYSIHGNGDPGLKTTVAVLEEKVASLGPSRKKKIWSWSVSLGALIGLGTAILELLG